MIMQGKQATICGILEDIYNGISLTEIKAKNEHFDHIYNECIKRNLITEEGTLSDLGLQFMELFSNQN